MENSAEQGKLDWDKSAKELFSSGMGGPDTKELLHSMPEFNRKQIIFHLKTVLKEAYERDKDEQAKIDAEIAECWYLVEYIDFQKRNHNVGKEVSETIRAARKREKE